MRPADILEYVRRSPFKPFQITLTDGRTYEIHHPELAMVGRSTVAIGIPADNEAELIYERLVTVDLLHIMEAEQLPATTSPPSGSG